MADSADLFTSAVQPAYYSFDRSLYKVSKPLILEQKVTSMTLLKNESSA